MSDVRDEVRKHYAEAATAVKQGCGSGCGSGIGSVLYEESERGELPDAAVDASLGCGNPIAIAELREGEVVLDLGSGGGIDVLLASKRVGDTGKVYGLDMTEEMLELAVANAREAGARNVEFLKGYIEAIPLPRATVDVVISNCVINLAADKPEVFAEVFRVLKPGGRVRVSDIVASNELSPEQRADRGTYSGCIAGALSIAEYEGGLRDAGFEEIEVTPAAEIVDGMHSSIITARKPEGAAGSAPERSARELPLVTRSCC